MFRFLSLLNLTRWIAYLSLIFPMSAYSVTDNVTDLFFDLKQSILQIRVIDIASGSKSAIGSGFVVDSNGLVSTNYHG